MSQNWRARNQGSPFLRRPAPCGTGRPVRITDIRTALTTTMMGLAARTGWFWRLRDTDIRMHSYYRSYLYI